jgi:gas vesicle protein
MANNNGGGFFSFLFGAAIGSAFGILYAPDKGKNTRDRLTYQLDKASDQLQEIVNDLLEGKTDSLEAVKSEGQKLIDDAIVRAEKLMSEVDALKVQIKEKKTDDTGTINESNDA